MLSVFLYVYVHLHLASLFLFLFVPVCCTQGIWNGDSLKHTCVIVVIIIITAIISPIRPVK